MIPSHAPLKWIHLCYIQIFFGRGDKIIAFCFTQSSSYNTGQIESLCIHLGHDEDMNADRNGARLPAWLDRQSAFIFPPEILCTLADKLAQWKRGLNADDDIILQLLHCTISIYFIMKR